MMSQSNVSCGTGMSSRCSEIGRISSCANLRAFICHPRCSSVNEKFMPTLSMMCFRNRDLHAVNFAFHAVRAAVPAQGLERELGVARFFERFGRHAFEYNNPVRNNGGPSLSFFRHERARGFVGNTEMRGDDPGHL